MSSQVLTCLSKFKFRTIAMAVIEESPERGMAESKKNLYLGSEYFSLMHMPAGSRYHSCPEGTFFTRRRSCCISRAAVSPDVACTSKLYDFSQQLHHIQHFNFVPH